MVFHEFRAEYSDIVLSFDNVLHEITYNIGKKIINEIRNNVNIVIDILKNDMMSILVMGQ